MSELTLKPITFSEAKSFIQKWHRHHLPPQGHKFSIGAVTTSGKLVGIACVGRPVARFADDGWTAEVTRLCTDGTKNVCSILYGASARAAKAMGYKKIITYVLAEESGTSLRASGWVQDRTSPGGSWSSSSRPRVDKHPVGKKLRWVRLLSAGVST